MSEGVEIRGVVAMNGRGELCFFAHSRADGVPIRLSTERALSIDLAPARRIGHALLASLDPEDMGGEGRR